MEKRAENTLKCDRYARSLAKLQIPFLLFTLLFPPGPTAAAPATAVATSC